MTNAALTVGWVAVIGGWVHYARRAGWLGRAVDAVAGVVRDVYGIVEERTGRGAEVTLFVGVAAGAVAFAVPGWWSTVLLVVGVAGVVGAFAARVDEVDARFDALDVEPVGLAPEAVRAEVEPVRVDIRQAVAVIGQAIDRAVDELADEQII